MSVSADDVDIDMERRAKRLDLEDELADAEKRGNWTGKLDFILSCIGYAVGLGNVWRFPYLAFKNGGGAFLFPYIIMLFLTGLPLFFLELAIGQFGSQGPITLYKKLNRYFVGIGWAMVIISTLTSIYYNVIIMWSVFYLFASFTSDVPWQTCDPVWAGPYCMVLERIEDKPTDRARLIESTRRYNMSCVSTVAMGLDNTTIGSYDKIAKALDEKDYPSFAKSLTFADLELSNLPNVSMAVESMNMTDKTGLGNLLPTILRGVIGKEDDKEKVLFKECMKRIESPSGDFFHRYMLEIQNSEGADFYGLGGIRWQLLLTFIFTWIVIFLCMIKGVASSGKVVYFTATFPYVVLVALLIRGVTLPGCLMGIEFYIIPKWEKLSDPNVWSAAATQIFYSLGPGFGGLLTFSSYNKFKNNCQRDALIVALINCGTSIFAGFAVFSIIGFMAYSTGLEVSEVPVSGEGLLFIAYPEAIARMPAPPVWAILFFFMVFTLGLDSQFAMMETVVSALADQFHKHLRDHKEYVTFFCCLACLIAGLPCVTYGGFYIVTLMNWYCAGYSLMVVSLFNIIVIIYIYGMKNFAKDIKMMLGHTPNIYWYVTWMFITPIVCLFILIASAISDVPAYYRTYTFPPYVVALGWVTFAMSVCLIPLFFIIEMCWYSDTRAAIMREMSPSVAWGPALAENRVGRYALTNDNIDRDVTPIKNSRGTFEVMDAGSYQGDYGIENPAMDTNDGFSSDPPDYDTQM